jgi:putative intracellular protease/amidase
MDDPNIDQLMKDFDGKIIYYTENTKNMYSKKNRIISVNDTDIALYHNGSLITIENTLKKYNKKYSKQDVMAAIGGIWTYYDIMNNTEILQKFITNYHKLKYKI